MVFCVVPACSDLAAGPLLDTSSTASGAEVAAVIAAIKQRYKLKHIYAWHAILGYWSGVAASAVAAAPAAAAAGVASDALAAATAAAPSGGSKTSVIAAATEAAVAAASMDAEAEAVEPAAAAAEEGPAGAVAGTVADAGDSSGGCNSSAVGAAIVLPRVSDAMSGLEPPTNWSQLVSEAAESLPVGAFAVILLPLIHPVMGMDHASTILRLCLTGDSTVRICVCACVRVCNLPRLVMADMFVRMVSPYEPEKERKNKKGGFGKVSTEAYHTTMTHTYTHMTPCTVTCHISSVM